MTGDKKLYGGKYETFAESVKAEPDKFDDMDCRPGPAALDPEYSDSLIPEFMRERLIEIRRKRRADVALASETARRFGAGTDGEMFKRAIQGIAKPNPKGRKP